MMSCASVPAEEEMGPEDLVGVMSGMDLVVSMRLHGLVMALAAGVPVVALTYAEETKVRELMLRIGEEESLFDVRALDAGRLSARISRLLDEGGRARERHRNAGRALRKEIESFNVELFGNLAARFPALAGKAAGGAVSPRKVARP